MATSSVDLLKLRQALEASWAHDTAFAQGRRTDNPAYGNCYPTARVVQYFFPNSEIVEGRIMTPDGIEKHFWNMIEANGQAIHIDLTWQQFPHGSKVKSWRIRNRETLGDGPATVKRVELLLTRVKQCLAEV